MKTTHKIFNFVFRSVDDLLLLPKGDFRERIERCVGSKGKELCSFDGTRELIASIRKLDYTRAGQPELSDEQLFSENKGLWELWEQFGLERDGNVSALLRSEKNPIARNPVSDVSDGVVGIDFGTSSTVVAYEDESEKQVIRIGTKDLSSNLAGRDFEAPTLVEFRDVVSFKKAYDAKDGRPYTRQEDFTFSYAAKDSMENIQDGKDFARFFGKLKQWAMGRVKCVEVIDKKGHTESITTYDECEKGSIDPIELYAYMIGLSINNQQRGRIFLKYIISSPVTFSDDLKKKIKKSFEKGLKKSLPLGLLYNKEVMEKFSVDMGISEPMAYVVGAIQRYKIKDDSISYGVFDFGGGTTDFDFGVFRKAKGKESGKWMRVFEQKGFGGDELLGGENILDGLAYDVYKGNNFSQMRENGFQIALPSDGCHFPGGEMFVNDSAYARGNLHMIAEAIRPLWEKKGEWEQIKNSGEVTVSYLVNSNGEVRMNVPLLINADEIKRKIRTRIESGCKKFFMTLERSFTGNERKKVHIFLAGNSSRSSVVHEVFEEKIASYKAQGEDIDYELHKPLDGAEEDPNLPTAKTGVALGLLSATDSSNIGVIPLSGDQGEAPFKYFVGLDDGMGVFSPVLYSGASYKNWSDKIPLRKRDFTLYYTTDAGVMSEDLSISSHGMKKIKVELSASENPNDTIQIKCSKPDEIVLRWKSSANGKGYGDESYKLEQ